MKLLYDGKLINSSDTSLSTSGIGAGVSLFPSSAASSPGLEELGGLDVPPIPSRSPGSTGADVSETLDGLDDSIVSDVSDELTGSEGSGSSGNVLGGGNGTVTEGSDESVGLLSVVLKSSLFIKFSTSRLFKTLRVIINATAIISEISIFLLDTYPIKKINNNLPITVSKNCIIEFGKAGAANPEYKARTIVIKILTLILFKKSIISYIIDFFFNIIIFKYYKMPNCSIEEAWGDNFNNENTNINKEEEDYSRTYNRLSEHSGPETRLPKKRKNKRKKKDTVESYSDTNSFVQESIFQTSEQENRDDNITEENSQDKSLYLDLLRENQELKNIISSIQNQSLDTDNIFDLVLFISSGVFIIFILDIFVKNIKRF